MTSTQRDSPLVTATSWDDRPEPATRSQVSWPSLGQALGIAARRRWYLVLLGAAVLAAAAVATASMRPGSYTATASVLVAEAEPVALQVVGIQGDAPWVPADRRMETLVQFARTADVLAAAAAPNGLTEQGFRSRSDAASRENANVLDLTATASTAEDAATLAEAYARSFVDAVQARDRALVATLVRAVDERLAQVDAAAEPELRAQLVAERIRLSLLAEVPGARVSALGAASVERSELPLVVLATGGAVLGALLGLAVGVLGLRRGRTLEHPGQVAARIPQAHLLELPLGRSGDRTASLAGRARLRRFRRVSALLGTELPLARGTVVVTSDDRDLADLVAFGLAAASVADGRTALVVATTPSDSDVVPTSTGRVGFSTLLSGSADTATGAGTTGVEGATSAAVAPPGDVWPPVRVLGPGPEGPPPAGATGVADAVTALRSAADTVLLTGPSLGDSADLLPLVLAADAVVVVVRLGVTPVAALDDLAWLAASGKVGPMGALVVCPER